MTKVLIVDDSFMMREIVKDIVSADSAFEIVGEAENGQECLDLAKEHKPDIILLDIEMPVMDGLEALKRLKLVSQARVLIISSVAQIGSSHATQAREFGAFDVVAKPSGALSMDLEAKKGSDILNAMRRACDAVAA